MEVLLCKHLNLTPKEFRRMPYVERLRLEAAVSAILQTKPELLVLG